MSSASPPRTTFVFEEIQSNSRISTPLSILLENLDAIPSSTIPSGFIRNTKLLGSLYSKKQLQIDVIVSEFAPLYTIPINFNALFEQRMVACGNTLTKTQTEHYTNVLDFYLQFKIANNENRVAAKSLLSYLESHAADPDNSLIGLTPSKSILESLHSSQEEEKAPASLPKPDGPFHTMFSTQELIEMILTWDEMTDDDAAICLHQFAASARNHSYSPSSLLASSLTPSSISRTNSTSNLARTPSSSILSTSSSQLMPPPSSPIPTSVSQSSIPKNMSSPALLRSSSYSNLSYSASPPASPSAVPASPSRAPSFSLFPSLFKKSIDFKMAAEKTPWKEGDVVVVFVGMVNDSNNKEGLLSAIKIAREELNENAFMFARVSDPCIDGEHNVGVYIDRNETKTRVVGKESVFMLKFDQASQAMVYDVSQRFFGKLTQKLAERANLFLVSQGLDLQVLERALENDSSFFDMPALMRNIACVHSLQMLDSITWSEFLATVRTHCEAKVKRFLADIETEGRIFPLSRKPILAQLNNFDYASIPLARLQSYLTASQTAIDNLKSRQEDILNGTTKQHLSEWYLGHIKEAVDQFLTRNGFELDVIPENYIDQAPKDLALVDKNWTMVRELLDVISHYDSKCQTRHEVIDVMTSLMDDIYTKLEEFVRDALYVLYDKLGATRTYFEVSENQEIYDELCKVFDTKKPELDADLRDKLEELMKDVEYIFKIREMEGMQSNKSRDHVPISGLIASRFFRLENELRTSLDVWDPERLECSQASSCQDAPLENATLEVEAVQ